MPAARIDPALRVVATHRGRGPAACGPTRALSAWLMSPVDTPCRYSYGTAASTERERRTYGGTSLE
jgi:hypothetical protein